MIKKFTLIAAGIALVAATVSAAPSADTTSATKQVVVQAAPAAPQKALRAITPPKGNWSKIKDLFL